MTNEEKAKELVGYDIDTPRSSMRMEARDEYDDLIKMAKWKDEDFLAYLVDLRERVKTAPEISCIDRIISERFSELYNEANDVNPRTEPDFCCQGRICSWNDLYSLIGKEAMMHDYPYYFDEDGNDIFPNER